MRAFVAPPPTRNFSERSRSDLGRRQQLEQRFLGVTAVLRLVPDPLSGAVKDVRSDFLARMRGQAVKRDRVRRGFVQERLVETKRGERGSPISSGFWVVAHAHPNIGIDSIGVLYRLFWVVGYKGRSRGVGQGVAVWRGKPYLDPGD